MGNRPKPMARRSKDRSQPIALATHLRAHAAAVMAMPAGEQFIGARDVAFHSAMLSLAEWVEDVERRLVDAAARQALETP